MRDVNVPLVGALGAGAGLSLGIFVSEVVSRITAQTGWTKFGIRAVFKGAIAGVFYLLSGRFGGLLAFGLEISSYSCLGSLIPDLMDVAMPGGFLGAAEQVAVAVRMTGRTVNRVPTDQRVDQRITASPF